MELYGLDDKILLRRRMIMLVCRTNAVNVIYPDVEFASTAKCIPKIVFQSLTLHLLVEWSWKGNVRLGTAQGSLCFASPETQRESAGVARVSKAISNQLREHLHAECVRKNHAW